MQPSSNASPDDAVRGTNDDATISRASAVIMGYLQDPFIKTFCKRPARRPPIINRGTYSRSSSIDVLVHQFVRGAAAFGGGQVVALGAGFDTRYFLLKSMNLQCARYFEVDFPEITSRKAMLMKKDKTMGPMLGENKIGDLREWESNIVPKLKSLGFDESCPTLYLSECVLVYMEEEYINSILSWCARSSAASFFITYEQIRPEDAFGKVMIENLRLRNISLPGLESCPTLESHVGRFKSDRLEEPRRWQQL
ncbi:S-adenosyl-L-methionine-dependent methyltransferase [Chytridium lagenaria]|nr:S-adenosyl-L-methionine-dependent methyltransferase [Chytridium lagenaria]